MILGGHDIDEDDAVKLWPCIYMEVDDCDCGGGLLVDREL